MVTLKFFAALRQAVGAEEIRLELKRPCPVRMLVQSIEDRYPRLVTLFDQGKLLVSVNEEVARSETVVKDGDEVALMPPFSGGGLAPTRGPEGRGRRARSLLMARIQKTDFSIDAEVARVKEKSRRIGGIAIFLGSAREFSKGHEVLSIALEQYAGMAEKKIRELREAALEKFPIIELSIIHRIGELAIGDNIVLIIAGAEHRAQAFEACRWCIDELKRTVPLWKKEKTPSGEVWVEDRP
jgi:MoaD family protein